MSYHRVRVVRQVRHREGKEAHGWRGTLQELQQRLAVCFKRDLLGFGLCTPRRLGQQEPADGRGGGGRLLHCFAACAKSRVTFAAPCDLGPRVGGYFLHLRRHVRVTRRRPLVRGKPVVRASPARVKAAAALRARTTHLVAARVCDDVQGIRALDKAAKHHRPAHVVSCKPRLALYSFFCSCFPWVPAPRPSPENLARAASLAFNSDLSAWHLLAGVPSVRTVAS